ncbi:Pr6Pr family membrane protein [Microbacterium sp. Au-Mic1]|uniref:Pr6Pr family membrane protein n=1 Tax=Microbacterium sp. Au-Mic1 TaxID=2906457 RepID=UPI001E436410|nr:Pr6Pr family membrane protein [Microbacterium sp. Au-Mic1]MCE4025880.1 Pr6Pr family membrane protein [Microbacterium sp. Au-Mic1]
MQISAPERSATRPARFTIDMRTWSVVRLVGALAILTAVATQLTITMQNALGSTTPWGSHLPTVVTNFLSFFTIESNVSSAVALILAAIWGLRVAASSRGASSRSASPSSLNDTGAAVEPRWLAILLACTSTYMIVTGIVYNTLLRGIELPQGTTVVWANEMMHVVGPLILLADVLLAPRRRCLGWGALGIIAAFPIVWAGYTLIRANLIIAPATGEHSWYPYPFLNPALVPGGYLGVAGYIVGIAVAILAVGAGVIWVSRKRGS